MQKSKKNITLALLSLSIVLSLLSWGIYGHEHINHAAVLCLPKPLQTFFYNHIDYITQESTVPDLRKYTLNDKMEYSRHFVDLENFGNPDSLPKTLTELGKKYDEKFLSQNGILPWYIESMMEKLTKAFKENRKTEIIFLAADLGHYLADAHMPLHTTVNHDGQLTDQKGVHAFWESQLPELFGEFYSYRHEEGKYIADVHAETWNIIRESHGLVDTLLQADAKTKENLPVGEIYQTDENGKILKNKFNQMIHKNSYASNYQKALKGMVEAQMKNAIFEISSYWYTAWVNAGKPDVIELDNEELTKNNASSLNKEVELLKNGKMVNLKSEKEF